MPRKHIDSHIHFFNTRYLPLKGLLLNRTNGNGWPILFVADAITLMTPEDSSLDPAAPAAMAAGAALAPAVSDQPPLTKEGPAIIDEFVDRIPESFFNDHHFPLAAKNAAATAPATMAAFDHALVAPGTSLQARREYLRKQLHIENAKAKIAAPALSPATVPAAATLLAPATAPTVTSIVEDIDELGKSLEGIIRFVGNLMRKETTLVTDAIDNQAGVGLFIHMMMDMDKVFESDSNYSYTRAIDRVRNLCAAAAKGIDGRPPVIVLPMIAFDPYRTSDKSLQLVIEALTDKAFLGVKFYPPLGYRPTDNAKSVFENETPIELLDTRCKALFDFCLSQDIPIIAHCTPGGMELHPPKPGQEGTGENANPNYWKTLLNQDNKKYAKLRLCLAHVGGDKDWHPGTKHWALNVLSLCTAFKNVYSDLGDYNEIIIQKYSDIIADSIDFGLNYFPDGNFLASDKLLFGTDFPMPALANSWKSYYQTFFNLLSNASKSDKSPFNPALAEKIFRTNALSFINLDAYLQRAGAALTTEQKVLINKFKTL